MQRQRSILLTLVMMIALALLCGCAKDEAPPVPSAPQSASLAQGNAPSSQPEEPQNPVDAPEPAVGELVVTFDYEKQSGHASNQFTVWIEDADGNFVKTLYATRFTANGGYQNRPDSIPMWVSKSGLASMSKPEVDAITSATPKAGELSYTWDLTANGNAVPPGEYRFFVEGSLRWKNRVLYSGAVEIGDDPVTTQADVQFFFEANDKQPALSDAAPETAMIGAVSASFSPGDKR